METSEEKPDTLPIRIDDLDRLQVLLASETVKRSHIQLELAQVRLDQAKAEFEKSQRQERMILQDVWERYHMNERDHFDTSTGMITREGLPQKS